MRKYKHLNYCFTKWYKEYFFNYQQQRLASKKRRCCDEKSSLNLSKRIKLTVGEDAAMALQKGWTGARKIKGPLFSVLKKGS